MIWRKSHHADQNQEFIEHHTHIFHVRFTPKSGHSHSSMSALGQKRTLCDIYFFSRSRRCRSINFAMYS
ncbi:MAG: hypothetical protein WCD87_09505, partial [Pseudolabrys sp.]